MIQQRGGVLLFVLIVLAVVASLGFAGFQVALLQSKIAQANFERISIWLVALSGLQQVEASLLSLDNTCIKDAQPLMYYPDKLLTADDYSEFCVASWQQQPYYYVVERLQDLACHYSNDEQDTTTLARILGVQAYRVTVAALDEHYLLAVLQTTFFAPSLSAQRILLSEWGWHTQVVACGVTHAVVWGRKSWLGY